MKSRWLGPVAVVGMLLFLAWAWPRLPERMVVHWGPSFRPDGWGSRSSVLVMPGVALGIRLLLPLLRHLDPWRERYVSWEPTFWLVVNLVVLLLAVVEVAVVGYNLGWPVDMQRVLLVAMGVLFVGLGNYMPRVRPNRWVGIRTPWTYASEWVWQETHRVGGRALVLAGLVVMGAGFGPAWLAPWLSLGALLFGALVPVIYSRVLWRREQSF